VTRPSARWPATLGDKLADWDSLAKVGGTRWIVGKSVLDIGPGRALDVQLLAPEAGRYCVLDPDSEVLAWVEHVAPPEVECVKGTAEALPFPGGTFDLVLDFSTIDNCFDPMQCYREVFRVLKIHGLLLSSYANKAVLGDLPDQHTQDPNVLQIELTKMGYWRRWHERLDQARAVIAAQKYGEAVQGKFCSRCQRVHTEVEA